jgi:hypothetical protein
VRSGNIVTNEVYPCSLTAKLLLAFASIVILASESHGTHDLILLSDGSGNLQTDSPCPLTAAAKLLLALAGTVILGTERRNLPNQRWPT